MTICHGRKATDSKFRRQIEKLALADFAEQAKIEVFKEFRRKFFAVILVICRPHAWKQGK
ncbi:hypothetical protein [Lelliottia wanjuensis]|uniref:hypothetical protein n=1 Tax=Lelliottia wanjuensis TaxID=3050585 RepID=UPI003306D425